MNEFKNISKRLRLIASFIPKGVFFADIGSDHAYLPRYVCLNDETASAIAGEVNVGPYNRATEVVQASGLEDVIDVRLGDGLDVIKGEDVSSVVIAGMGGSLITSILERGKAYLTQVDHLVLQPNVGERSVRRWLLHNDYYLTNEKILYENGHYYEILVAEKNNEQSIYNEDKLEKQLLFGPYLLEEKSDIFKQKWQMNYNKLNRMINQMKKAKDQDHERIEMFQHELNWIEEVIK